MKLNIIISLFILSIFSLEKKSFEGNINYTVEIEILYGFKRLGIDEIRFKEQLINSRQFFEKVTYSYKNGNYRIVSKYKKNKYVQIYLNKTNKIYNIQKDVIYVRDASIDLQEKLRKKKPKVELLKEKEVINGRECNIVKVTWEMGTYYYYYQNNFLKMNSQIFKNHKYDMFNEYLKLSNSLPVKVVKITGNLIKITLTLDTYEEITIDDSIFTLPSLPYRKLL